MRTEYTQAAVISKIPPVELALIERAYAIGKGDSHRLIAAPARSLALHLANMHLLRRRRRLLAGPEARSCDWALDNLTRQIVELKPQIHEELVCFIANETARLELEAETP